MSMHLLQEVEVIRNNRKSKEIMTGTKLWSYICTLALAIANFLTCRAWPTAVTAVVTAKHESDGQLQVQPAHKRVSYINMQSQVELCTSMLKSRG